MPAGPAPLPVGGQGNGGADLLSKVKLLSFTASPDHILPFESSTLRWQVQTPGDVAFSLDGFVSTVPAVGREVVEPAFTSEFMLQARARQAEVTLGTVTVWVDTSQCVRQTRADIAGDLWVLLSAAARAAATNHGDTLDIPSSYPPSYPLSVTINPGVIAYEIKGPLTLNLSTTGVSPTLSLRVPVNIDVKGSFGLMVDRTADQLAPTNGLQNVSCDIDWYRWISWIGASMAAGGIVLALVGLVFGNLVAVIGLFLGLIAGGIGAAALYSIIINTVTSVILSNLPGGIATLVHTISSIWFTEPTGMAMAAVSIDPDPMAPPDGNIIVTFCPKTGAGGGTAV
jgi:hypothetical protein